MKLMKNVVPGFLALSIAALAGSAALLTGCAHTDSGHQTSGASVHKYTCEMHPEVTSDTPGKCPKCGMDLVQK
jgi:hypothetical protein